jgi:hypothetical protein
MVADVASPHTERILTESGVGPFHLALEKLLADKAGTTLSYGIPRAEYAHFTPSILYLRAEKSP